MEEEEEERLVLEKVPDTPAQVDDQQVGLCVYVV
jgi:hypothetical protein